MNNSLALDQAPIKTLFWRYTLPTIASMLVTGVYVIIDGMFVGHFLGEQGLAAIMLGYPIGAILYAIGALWGMGASALVSIKLGQKETVQAQSIVGQALTLSILSGLLLTTLGLYFGRDILLLLGAEGEILEQALDYLHWYYILGIFAILSMSFSALLRNDGQPTRVTYIMILGGVLNVIFDWIFIVVIPWQLKGAAIATMLAQAITAILCLYPFFTAKTELRITWQSIRLNLDTSWQITKLGMSSFLMYLYLSVVLTLHNFAFLRVGQTIHVAAYSIISYSESFFYLLFEGIALGIQPLTSFNTGANKPKRVLALRNMAFTITLVVSIISVIGIYLYPSSLAYLFAGDHQELTPFVVEGSLLYFWGIPMEGLLLVGATYFQSTNRPKEALILTGGKLILIFFVMGILSSLFGVTGVWLSLPVCSTILTIWMLYTLKRLKI
ncbi:MATE family efflux transporter [Vibrio sp. SS-MA-C1-2]|uniref:MATE family efflux transporter n=1 Tax=Vibrio sp. SS-MA-C1-2 TaxID=2908646 RepID=UPI001F2CD27B|nr:MATE family efflux transporter [Vibrio sp. SS-MA-C1-2]UJF17402.1 MATE family efflux transporter [Vibrio sp. SS-MA-C1-2]